MALRPTQYHVSICQGAKCSIVVVGFNFRKEKPKYNSIQLKINGNIHNDSLVVATNFNHRFLNFVQTLGQNFTKIYAQHSFVCVLFVTPLPFV